MLNSGGMPEPRRSWSEQLEVFLRLHVLIYLNDSAATCLRVLQHTGIAG